MDAKLNGFTVYIFICSCKFVCDALFHSFFSQSPKSVLENGDVMLERDELPFNHFAEH